MPSAITKYTSFDDIRAVLGVSTEELEDVTLSLDLYSNYLQMELEDVDLTLPDTYVTVKALPLPITAVQERFLQSVRLYATYSVAKHLTASLPLFSAKSVADGKATVQRFDNPYKDTIAEVVRQCDKMRTRLIAALTAIGSTQAAATTLNYVTVSTPSTDPVTGV